MTVREPIGRFDWERLVMRCRLPDEVRLTALMLATFADPDGSRVRPGLPLLEALRGRDEKTCRRHIERLRKLGLLELVAKGNQHGPKTNVYRLTMPMDLADRVEIVSDPRTEHRTSKTSDAPASALDTQVSDADNPRPVDNSPALDTQMSDAPALGDEEHRTSEAEHRTFEGGAVDTQVSTYQPQDQPPRPNTSSGSSCVGAEEEGARDSPKTEHESDHPKEFDYRSASAFLLTLADLGAAAVAEATTELGDTADRTQIITRAAALAARSAA